ncbi:hypothetical protein Pla8534_69670 [Lignipirellula cremea]|uniref:Uncharacterized protein n=1 Tax=Lignipirellula cremea TaxID=2528010 RepID=A0A518E4P4_9BACT|nr:hypothetical protein Pla8534_69670 [Lignipirellula cremea]
MRYDGRCSNQEEPFLDPGPFVPVRRCATRLYPGETEMGDKGSKDKGKKEGKKKPTRTPEEKRKMRIDKKNK